MNTTQEKKKTFIQEKNMKGWHGTTVSEVIKNIGMSTTLPVLQMW